jgi:hypothetical protein
MLSIDCIALVSLSTVSVALVFLSTLPADEQEPFLGAEARLEKKVYRNEKFGYTVFYPDHWFPQGINYSNKFEILNYDPENPQSVPQRNRVSVIFIDTVYANEEITSNYLDSLLVEKNLSVQHSDFLFIDNHRAVRVRKKTLSQLQDKKQPATGTESTRSSPPDITPYVREIIPEDYAPGGKDAIPPGVLLERRITPEASKAITHGALPDKSKSSLVISTYIANGKHLISIEAFVPKEADASVIEEIIQIEERLKFNKVKNK